tara:strand:+ start:243 stop:458 length:216 start_codon:yes stop_codon:yes gene_type:complete
MQILWIYEHGIILYFNQETELDTIVYLQLIHTADIMLFVTIHRYGAIIVAIISSFCVVMTMNIPEEQYSII